MVRGVRVEADGGGETDAEQLGEQRNVSADLLRPAARGFALGEVRALIISSRRDLQQAYCQHAHRVLHVLNRPGNCAAGRRTPSGASRSNHARTS
jgi:hypothetical protein